MRRRVSPVFALAAAALAAAAFLRAGAPPALAAPQVFTSPINGGCYIAAANVCKIHIDPFTINVSPGVRLLRFTLYANGQPLYDFRTDVSNPPSGNYSPSLVSQDFAARCGVTYTVNIVGQDNMDANPLNMGQAEGIVCPSAVP